MPRLINPLMDRIFRHRWMLVAFVVFALLVCLESLAVACPTCKDTIAGNDPNRETLVRGYFYSIIFMVSMPFLILTGLCSYFYYEVCKARRLQRKAGVVAKTAALTASVAAR